MPQKKENSVGAGAASQTIDDSMDGMRARVKVLETKLADFDHMALRLAALERDLAGWKNDAAGEVRKLFDEEKERQQMALVAGAGAAEELKELDRKVQELDTGLRHLDQCVVKCSRGFAQFEKEQRQNVAHLQVNLKERVREVFAKVDVCASRNEIKMAMKSVQFDMLNHSNACRSLARGYTDLKKKLDVKVDTDDGIEQILQWDSAAGKPDAVKPPAMPSDGSPDGKLPVQKDKPSFIDNKNIIIVNNNNDDDARLEEARSKFPPMPPGPPPTPPPGPPPDLIPPIPS